MQQSNITKDELNEKPYAEWSEPEKEVAKTITHTLGTSLYNARRLSQHGDKGQSWDQILGNALDLLEDCQTNKPGLYLVNSTGEAYPALLEDGSGDRTLLEEELASHDLRLIAEWEEDDD